jgi:hypothetical protein
MDEYERALHSAILRNLKITEPPYRLTLEPGAGDMSIVLYDPRGKAPNDPGLGRRIYGNIIREGLLENEIPATSKLLADEIRPLLQN